MSIETERALRPLELRAEGRRLEGIVLQYEETSPSHRERFLPGAFSLDPGTTRWLDYRHDRTRVLAHTEGGGLTLRDSPEALLLEAELPSLPLSERALDEIASGRLQGPLKSSFMRRRNPGMARSAWWRRRILPESGSSRPLPIRPPESRPERQELFLPASLGTTLLHASAMVEGNPERPEKE